jgi:hypothetical protein
VWVIGITATQSAPIAIGRDENQPAEFTQNYHASTAAPTAHRPAITTT